MKQSDRDFLREENRKAQERYKVQVQKENEEKLKAIKEQEKMLEEMMRQNGGKLPDEDLELNLKKTHRWKKDQTKNIKNLDEESSPRGRGRPKKTEEEKLRSKNYCFRLSGDYFDLFESLEGKDSGAKCRDLIDQYAALRNMVIGQVNQLKSAIYSARKIFNEMKMTRTIYKYKVSGSLEMAVKEKELNEKLKHFVKVAQTLIKIGNFKGTFMKKELERDELEFLNWILFEVH